MRPVKGPVSPERPVEAQYLLTIRLSTSRAPRENVDLVKVGELVAAHVFGRGPAPLTVHGMLVEGGS